MPINVTAGLPGTVHYIPHRTVIRDDRDTTKIRVVYDASANKNRPSLNESLETSPCLLPKIFDILVRFRVYKYGLTSDIKTTFLNIRIVEVERDFLKFLWISNIEEDEPEVIVKRFISVEFGLKCSPFLLEATIKYHMEKHFNRDFNSETVEHFLRDLYMDESISGAQTEDDLFNFYLCVKISLTKEGLIFVNGSRILSKYLTMSMRVNILGNLLQRKRKFVKFLEFDGILIVINSYLISKKLMKKLYP